MSEPATAAVPDDRPPLARVAYRAYEQKSGNAYTDRFIALWNDIHNPANGYFSPEGVPYHAVETLLCEAPDYGHETTSEAFPLTVAADVADRLAAPPPPPGGPVPAGDRGLVPRPRNRPTPVVPAWRPGGTIPATTSAT